MAAIIGYDIGQRLCEALGLGDKMVTNLRLDIPHDGAVTVEATMLVEEAAGDGLVEVLKWYELREREGPDLGVRFASGKIDIDEIRRMEQVLSVRSETRPWQEFGTSDSNGNPVPQSQFVKTQPFAEPLPTAFVSAESQPLGGNIVGTMKEAETETAPLPGEQPIKFREFL